MIRRLTLHNWRNYEDVSLDFGEGTTFVVASNGVGKTSLVEAARWALFGRRTLGDHTAVRAGAPSAVAGVHLQLPDERLLSIERTLSVKPRGAVAPPVVRIDGIDTDPAKLDDYFSEVYGAQSGFLAGLTMPTADRNAGGPSTLDFEEHLGRYYGVEGMRRAIDKLGESLKVNQASIRQVKQSNSDASQKLTQLISDAEQAERRARATTEDHRTLQKRQDQRRQWDAFRREQQELHLANERSREARKQLTARVSADLGLVAEAESLAGTLNRRRADLDSKLDDARLAIAVNAAREQALAANQDRLGEARDDCPVCRRPLDGTTVATATSANQRELSSIRESNRELAATEADLRAARDRVAAWFGELRSIPEVRFPSTEPSFADDVLGFAELDAMVDEAMDAAVEARARQLQAERQRDEALASDEAMRQLEVLFRQEAALRVAIEATELTLAELLDDTIRPLAAEVNQRWKGLFPGRGDLTTRSDGSVTRTVNGHALPYDSFSTGEGMGVTILFRLLVAQMATAVDFCWFDEPLEHLDPDTRRKVASLLSRVTRSGGSLKQVVVTTYEEPLARLLHARDEENVTLLDVRQA